MKIDKWDDKAGAGRKPKLVPNYEDERLVVALETFIQALGKRYDGDPRIAYITAGLLGLWGEWHTSPHGERFASVKTQKRILAAYDAAFIKTSVLLRYPAGKGDLSMAQNDDLRMGYHDDSFAWSTLNIGPNKAYSFMSLLEKAGASAVNKWRTQPIGGEIRPEVWGQIFDEKPIHPSAQNFDQCVRATHVTWLMDSGMFKEDADAARYANALKQVQLMGYDFYVPTVEIARVGTKVHVRIGIVNQGVAPFYQDWPVEIAALDAEGVAHENLRLDWKLTQVQPGEPARLWVAAIELPAATYKGHTLALRVPHPLPEFQPLRFANAEQDRDAPGWLSLGKVP